jgi:hypothetical protein
MWDKNSINIDYGYIRDCTDNYSSHWRAGLRVQGFGSKLSRVSGQKYIVFCMAAAGGAIDTSYLEQGLHEGCSNFGRVDGSVKTFRLKDWYDISHKNGPAEVCNRLEKL